MISGYNKTAGDAICETSGIESGKLDMVDTIIAIASSDNSQLRKALTYSLET